MPFEFAQYLLRTEHMLIVCSTWVVISAARRLFPGLDDNRLWVRMLPVVPLVVCSVAVWLPDMVPEPWPTRTLLGLVLGALSTQGHKILRQTVFGNDDRIRGYRSRL